MVYKSVGPFQIYCYLQLFLKNLKKFTLFRNNIKNMKFCNVKCTKEIFRNSYFLLYSCYIVIELYLKHCIYEGYTALYIDFFHKDHSKLFIFISIIPSSS